MHSLKSITEVPSQKYPGITYHVRTLNVIQRARRDQLVAKERAEYSRLSAERDMLLESLIGKGGTDEEREAKYQALNPEQRARDNALFQQVDALLQGHLLPNVLTFGLVRIDGYEVDGEAASVQALIDHAPDDLLTEAYKACLYGAGLSGDEAKN